MNALLKELLTDLQELEESIEGDMITISGRVSRGLINELRELVYLEPR